MTDSLKKLTTIIMAGGKGERLFPLTRDKAKPAITFGSLYRIIDFTLSNCLNSGIRRIYVLSQYGSFSLDQHLRQAWDIMHPDLGEFIYSMPPQQIMVSRWYRGTADSIFQNLNLLEAERPKHVLILSGDHVYKLNYREMLAFHLRQGADLTVAAVMVHRAEGSSFGILKVNAAGEVENFLEKPADPPGLPDNPDFSLVSMGVYIFNAGVLERALDNDLTDFGKEVIPQNVSQLKLQAYLFPGYWEDIGTIRSFYETNISLTTITPEFDFYNEDHPIYTRRRDLPASKINACVINQSLTADGCIITNANIMNSIVGIRTIIESGATLDGVVCMGADYYESAEEKARNRSLGIPDIGIGRGTLIRKAIIDKNARIGEVCRIGVDSLGRPEGDFGHYYIRDGIIIIPKNAVVPPGSVI